MLRLVAALLILIASAVVGNAAKIYADQTSLGVPFIVIQGEFVSGDDRVFNNLAISLDQATVLFDSGGGLADVGMTIGRTIAIKGFSTMVPPNAFCASSCALAWLAGRPKFVFPSSKVGFHAIFTADAGSKAISSDGNALVGSYLRELGLSNRAIIYITRASPDSMTWLSQQDALAIGLTVETISDDDKRHEIEQEPKPVLPTPQSAERTEQRQSPVDQAVAIASPHAAEWITLSDLDLPGFDIAQKPLTANSPTECKLVCARTPKCTAYTYNQDYKACFLKWGASQAFQFTGAYSGYMSSNSVTRVGREYSSDVGFRTSKGTEIIAMPYSTYMSKSLAWCQDDCVDDFQCKGFSLYRNGICLKFRDTKPTQRNADVYSGVKVNK